MKIDKSYRPLISVIMVVYNAIETIENTIKSIINQSYERIEYVVIDGGSSDGSLELIKKYEDRIATLVSEKDDGVYHAMNKGLDKATGDWVIFLGADDLLLSPTIIEELIPYFIDYEEIYYGNTYIKTINRLYNGKVNKWSMSLGNVSHQAIFYPKSVYKNKSYDQSYRIFADHIYNIELYASHLPQFVYLPKLISIYAGIGISATSKDEKYEETLIQVVIKNFGYLCGIYVWLRRKIYSLLKILKK